MERGYSVIYQEDKIISKLDELDPNKDIRVSLSDGEFEANILKDTIKRRG